MVRNTKAKSRPSGREQSLDAERLYRIANSALLKILGQKRRDHDDLLQVVVERVLRSIRDGSFSGECSLATWVSVIARNAAVDWVRWSTRGRGRLELTTDPELLDAEAARSSPSPEPHLEARSLLRYAEHVLDGMTPAHRETLLLHDLHGRDLAAIASASRVSIAAAQSRLVRGRHELKRRLLEVASRHNRDER